MRSKHALFIGVLAVAIAVGGSAPWRDLPSCLIGKWTGITATDAAGDLLGPEDANDWGCLGAGAGGRSATRAADVPVPPPTDTCLLPAYPNPTSGFTTMRFTLPSPSRVSLVVYGKKGNGPHGAFPVRTLVDGDLAAGMHSVVWDGYDDRGVRVAPGIYRVAMVVGDDCVCGDIEVR